MGEIIFGQVPVDEKHRHILLGFEALAGVFGGRDALVSHMAQNRGVKHQVPEIQQLAARLNLVDLPGFGDER